LLICSKMKKKIEGKISLEGIKAEIKGNKLVLEKDGKKCERKFKGFKVKIEGGELVFGHDKATKREKKIINTFAAHVKNMINGLKEGYVYKLKICSAHFPMTVNVDEANKKVVIKNFLGESVERKAEIPDDVKIKIEGEQILVESHDKEKAGQAAANIEAATKIKAKDRTRFQDGIFIIEKPKKEIKEIEEIEEVINKKENREEDGKKISEKG